MVRFRPLRWRVAQVGVVAASLLIAPAPGADGELLRWRTPDGREGIADDPARLPPGAEIVSRRERRPASAAGAGEDAGGVTTPDAALAPDAGASAATDDADVSGDADTGSRFEERLDRAQRCESVGLAHDCSAEQLDVVAGWRGRARMARERRIRAEERLAEEEERWRRCQQELVLVACRERALTAAEAEVRRLEAEEQRVHDECRREGCLPGWLEESAGPDPVSADEGEAARSSGID